MTTAGGFVFFGDGYGAIVAADANDGEVLWHFETGQQFKGSPMAYTIDSSASIRLGGLLPSILLTRCITNECISQS